MIRLANEDYILKLRAEFEDKLTSKIEPLQGRLKRLDAETKKAKEIRVIARDTASATIDTVRSKLKVLKDQKAGIDIKAHSKQAEENLLKLMQAKKNVARDVRMKISANSSTAKRHLKELEKAKRAVQKDVRFEARADVQQAKKNLADLKKAKEDLKSALDIRATVKDLATKGLKSIWKITKKLVKGFVIPVAIAGVRTAKTGLESLSKEQGNKVTINRVFKNSGMTDAQAAKASAGYYKDLEAFSMVTPFTPDEMVFFGTKAAQIEKGDRAKSLSTSKMMANVAAFRSDRTPDEIAEAFFSASVGNMEMLNNMLGTHYQNWEEAIQGINKDYNGMVEELSKTLPGAWSTFTGIVQSSAKEMMRPFGEAAAEAFAHISEKMLGFKDFISENSKQFAHFGEDLKEAFQPAVDAIDGIFSKLQTADGLSMIDGMLNGISAFIEGISEGVAAASEMVGSTMSVVESAQIEGFGEVAGMVLGGIIQFIGLIISGMIQIAAFIGDIKNGWDTLCEGITTKFSSTMDNVKKWWSDFKTKFGLDSDSMKNRWNSVCDGIKDKFKSICDKVKDLWQGVKDFLSHPIQTVVNGIQGLGHASGLARVPYDNYPARLHEGEKILSRREADLYDKNRNKKEKEVVVRESPRGIGNISIAKIADSIVIREEADIEKITEALVRNIKVQLA